LLVEVLKVLGLCWLCPHIFLLLRGGEDFEDIIRVVLLLLLVGVGSFSDLQDVRLDYLFYLAGWGIV